MLGRLLQNAASAVIPRGTSKSQAPLESITEETHTRDLLFPDPPSFRSNQQRPTTARDAANYDDRGGLDVTFPSDIRIIIAQDANSRYHQPQVLYDSKPPKTSNSRNNSPLYDTEPASSQKLSRGKSMTSPNPRRHHTPNSSIFSASQILPLSSPSSPKSPGTGFRSVFGDGRPRGSPFEPGYDHETAQGKEARETKEEMDALLGCMFGAPGFRLEPGTKLHVIPKRAQDNVPSGSKSPSALRPVSSGGFTRMRTPLVCSTSAIDASNESPSRTETVEPRAPTSSKPSIMFTRLFNVVLADSTNNESNANETSSPSDKHIDSPFDSPSKEANHSTPKNVKQKKVPMYAIAVVLQLPVEGHMPRLRPSQSQHGLSSSGSSYNDGTPSNSWKAEHSAFSSFMGDVRSHGSFDSVSNSHISVVLAHWNVISRSLELLELSAKTRLRDLLEQIPLAPLIAPPPIRVGLAKIKNPKQATQQSVFVHSDCLQEDAKIIKEADTIAQNIILGLRTRRVATGHGRWGAWREEARWVGRWAGTRDQNFFFFNFLTAFLGSHTEWLQSLSPSWYRKRYAIQQRLQGKDTNRVHQRTIIISSDKMAARRLIFLLAAFLPSTIGSMPHLHPALQASAFSYSESPPVLSAARQHSMYRRTPRGRNSSALRTGLDSGRHARSVSFSLLETDTDMDGVVFPGLTDRRDSDTRSIKSPSLAIPTRTAELRKASTSTTTADSTIPVPHFSSLTLSDTPANSTHRRPGSGGSLASMALNHNLKRSDSNTQSTDRSPGRWGSVVSGFWSSRRDSSTDGSDAIASSPTDRRLPADARRSPSAGKLARMVEESVLLEEDDRPKSLMSKSPAKSLSIENYLKPTHTTTTGGSPAQNIPRRQKPERMPIKLSLNESEGYIDIAMPPNHSFNSSLASSFASLRLPGTLLASSHEHYSPYGSCTPDSPRPRVDPVIDVAGYLKTYQPDFALQAVRPYDTLIDEVKESMRAEAQLTPFNDQELDPSGKTWTDVCVSLVADTTRFTIERLRLRRRRRAETTPTASRRGSSDPPGDEDVFYEEQIISEPVMDMDATLIDAVERVLAQSGDSSRATSPKRHSRPGSIRDNPSSLRRSASAAAMGIDATGSSTGPTGLEIPHGECRKTVLGALEHVVRSVVTEREERVNGRGRETDSSLREGVRAWLNHIDDGVYS